jgi:hypothetical protein
VIKRGPEINQVFQPNQTGELMSPVRVDVVPRGVLYVVGNVQCGNAGAAGGRWTTSVLVNGVVVAATSVLHTLLQSEDSRTVVVHEIPVPVVGDVIGLLVSTSGSASTVRFTAGRSFLWVFGEGFSGA